MGIILFVIEVDNYTNQSQNITIMIMSKVAYNN